MKSVFKKKGSVQPVAVDETEITYWHKGRQGNVTYQTGKEPLTNKPIEVTISFKNHLYKTTNPDEIKQLDEIVTRSPHVLKRFDEYQLQKASEPMTATLDAGGRKFTINLDALKEEYIKNHPELLAEQPGTDKPVQVISGLGLPSEKTTKVEELS